MTLATLLRSISADAARYRRPWLAPGFIATLCYRVSRHRRSGAPWLLPIEIALHVARRILGACSLHPGARIGPGLWLPHPEGIILNEHTVIGSRAILFQRVTVGQQGLDLRAVPRIGDGVTVFSGAVLAGAIEIGDRAIIGANTVVTSDVAADTMVRPAAMRSVLRVAGHEAEAG